MYLKNKRKLILIFLMIIILITGISLTIYYEINKEEESVVEREQQDQQEYLTQIDLELFNNDKTIKWNVNSEKLTRENNGSIYKMDILDFEAYENEELIYTGRGEKADYNKDKEIFSFTGDININRDDSVLQTNQIVWNRKNDIIKGEGGVRFETSQFVITSNKFSAPLSLNKIEFIGNEKAKAKVEWR